MILQLKMLKHRKSFFLWFTQFICLLGISVLFCYSCSATQMTYYVDYDNGNDNNKGDSVSAPFKHCPGDKNAIDNAGKTTLNAGDKVIFKGGTVYKGAIIFKWSGNIGKDIVYDGNSTNTFGKGKAILDGDNMSYTAAFDFLKKSGSATISAVLSLLKKKGFAAPSDKFDSYKKMGFITIVNFEIRGYEKYGIYLDTIKNVTIKNCHMHRISDWNLARCNGSKCNLEYVHVLGAGIWITGDSQNIVIDGCDIERTSHGGIKIQGNTRDVEVKNCDFHDYIHWMLDVAPLSDTHTVSNISIHDNKFRNLYHYASSWWTSWNGGGAHPEDEKIHAGVGENPHLDGIFVRNPMEGTLENIRIYNNEFYTEKILDGNAGTAMLYASQIKTGDSVYIYNNIFQYCPMYQSIYIYGTGGEVYMYNNTFYVSKNGAIRISGTTGRFFVKNNIFHMEDETGLVINVDDKNAAKGLESDYNIFKTPGKRFIYAGGSWISDLAQWQQLSKQDNNSLVVDDIKFVLPRDIAQSGQSDLRLQKLSPAINRGADLSSLFINDKFGTLRPQGQAWDIGAYEYKD